MAIVESSSRNIRFDDPWRRLWGFHIHEEVPDEASFANALVVQEQCARFLTEELRCPIDADDAIRPGYGPHLGYMWELRIERTRTRTVSCLGHAVAWMMCNHNGLGGYIHGTVHDETLPSVVDQLRQEGLTNQRHSMFFGHHRVAQRQDFFISPPLTETGEVVDTRTSRLMTKEQKDALLAMSRAAEGSPLRFVRPEEHILRGFHIHVDYYDRPEDQQFAFRMFDAMLIYMLTNGHRPTSTRLYDPGENGPHELAGWEIKYETRDYAAAVAALGEATAWLMCNRGHLPVFIHGVTWEEGDFDEELRAHKEVCAFIGELPPLRLAFFSDLKASSGQYRKKS